MCIIRRIAKPLLFIGLPAALVLALLTLGGGASPAATAAPAAGATSATGAPPTAQSDGASPTAAELQAFVKKAAAYVRQHGKAAALEEFSKPSGEFRYGEFYIFATDYSGVCLAQGMDPGKVGQNLIDMTDINGVKIVQKQIAQSKTGGGWFSYTWPNPANGDEQEPKLSYVLRAGNDWYLGSGTYGEAATRVPSRSEVKAIVDKAYAYAKAHGKRKAIARFMDPRNAFWVGQLYVFANNAHGITLCYPPDPSWLGRDRWNVKDADGKYYVRALVHTAMKHGSGWVRYLYVDPVSGGEPREKISYVRKVDDTWYVGAGTYVTRK